MKKIFIVILIVIVAVSATFLIGTGFNERTDVVLMDYSVSEDGGELTFNTGLTSSIGNIRGYKDNGGGVKSHYLTFYSTFGGLNSSFGAKDEFVIKLDKDDTEIYFRRPNGGYELVLKKNEETGEWERYKEEEHSC